jgi:hypothetical protein
MKNGATSHVHISRTPRPNCRGVRVPQPHDTNQRSHSLPNGLGLIVRERTPCTRQGSPRTSSPHPRTATSGPARRGTNTCRQRSRCCEAHGILRTGRVPSPGPSHGPSHLIGDWWTPLVLREALLRHDTVRQLRARSRHRAQRLDAAPRPARRGRHPRTRPVPAEPAATRLPPRRDGTRLLPRAGGHRTVGRPMARHS